MTSAKKTHRVIVNGDRKAKEYCMEIAQEIVKIFDIPLSEAIGRVNREFKNDRIFGPNQIYHRDVEYWANRVYYEADTYWWVDDWMAEHTPKPKPYP